MALFLVQHGLSLPKDQDPEKGLSDAGREDVQRIADVAANYGVSVSAIRHSGKKRALQTAEIMASKLHPANGVTVAEGLNPLDDVVAFAHTIALSENIMLVGHLPFMERLTAFLITGQISPPVFKFQNGGILCLDHYPETTQVVIKWALMPHIR